MRRLTIVAFDIHRLRRLELVLHIVCDAHQFQRLTIVTLEFTMYIAAALIVSGSTRLWRLVVTALIVCSARRLRR